MDHQVLIGGSPSTGSSLLVNILDRHAAISAGPETYLFIHPRLYTDWERYRRFLLRTRKLGGLKSPGWFMMNGAKLLQAEYGWSSPELEGLMRGAPDFPTFAGAYMKRRLLRENAQIWVEKSPANAMTLPLFLKQFPRSKVIHTTRDPYDAAASLLARGHDPYAAAGAYVVHTALALRVLTDSRAYLIRYEDLVARPEETLRGLLAFLGCPWQETILQPTGEERRKEVKMPGWLQNERGPIGGKSLGRFARLPEDEQDALVNALYLFRVNPAFARNHGLRHDSLASIAAALKYPCREAREPDRKSFLRQMWREKLRRGRRAYPAFGQRYPGGMRPG